MRNTFHPMFGSTMAFAAASVCSISTAADDQTSFDDSAMGGGSGGGVNLDKMREIDRAGDKSAGSMQMHQAMTDGDDDEDQGADAAGDASEQQDEAAADVVEAPGADTDEAADKPADGEQQGD